MPELLTPEQIEEIRQFNARNDGPVQHQGRELLSHIDALTDTLAERDAEIERLRTEGSPGVMNSIDKSFYDLAIRERDYERVRYDNLSVENFALRRVRDRLHEAGHEATCATAKTLIAAIILADPDIEPADCTCGWEARFQSALAEAQADA